VPFEVDGGGEENGSVEQEQSNNTRSESKKELKRLL
jgi:hypothetical protein